MNMSALCMESMTPTLLSQAHLKAIFSGKYAKAPAHCQRFKRVLCLLEHRKLTWSSGNGVTIGERDRGRSLLRDGQQVAVWPIRE